MCELMSCVCLCMSLCMYLCVCMCLGLCVSLWGPVCALCIEEDMKGVGGDHAPEPCVLPMVATCVWVSHVLADICIPQSSSVCLNSSQSNGQNVWKSLGCFSWNPGALARQGLPCVQGRDAGQVGWTGLRQRAVCN